ncbi:hypothetical protein G7062_09555 [Erysipelothrix sp. HDW6C]|uniref:hypothetical protein n=1 Tax=Erysipelothrix sp. HDW6C TaxID=2714930 RepID=UPI0014092BE5|nr:hypothetical protein [Erysipelothrix sp. HDW6C]QIK70534.1 hypothetical protein G7062_09555 [Erysipelothrix sp. HDW6C]
MTQGYNVQDLITTMKGNDVASFIHNQNLRFSERFGLNYSDDVSVTLTFESDRDAIDFYNEVRFNEDYAQEYTVKTSPFHSKDLLLSGAQTLYDYFGSREPNLLTVSRDLNINFAIEFVQDYSGTTFTGAVRRGELLSRQCIIEVSDILPELSLGGLRQIGRNQREFDDLLTRCYIVKGATIL